MLEYADVSGALKPASAKWRTLLPETPLQPDHEHAWPKLKPKAATHVRLNIYPDGGVARLRLFGHTAR